MSKGDFDWAVNELHDSLGSHWDNDEFGHTLLHMALYEGGSLSPDLQSGAYDGFIEYMTYEYEFDFEEEFDWDAYREWYDSQ